MYIYIYVCVCIYIYIYTHTHIYTHQYFLTQITKSSFSVPVVVRVLVDGIEVSGYVMLPGLTHKIEGVNTPQGLKQLVFAPPRVAASTGDTLLV